MTEFSKNILTEPMSRRERARVLGVQSVCAALMGEQVSERPILRFEQPDIGVGYTDLPTTVIAPIPDPAEPAHGWDANGDYQ